MIVSISKNENTRTHYIQNFFFVVNQQTSKKKINCLYIYYCSKSSSLIGTLKRIYSC